MHFCFAAVVLLLMLPVQASPAQVSVTFSMGLSPTSVLGFYDTLFPTPYTVTIANTGLAVFGGGNLTFVIKPPTEKYTFSGFVLIPVLRPGESTVSTQSFQPQEAGIYTFQVLWIDTPSGRIGVDKLQGGFFVQNFQGPELVYTILLGVLAIIASVVFARKRRR